MLRLDGVVQQRVGARRHKARGKRVEPQLRAVHAIVPVGGDHREQRAHRRERERDRDRPVDDVRRLAR
eukprot:106420-Prymnesium_polylepis.1